MASQSFSATPESLEIINRAMAANQWSREDLAKACDCSRQPAVKFCSGRSVSKKLFVSFCKELALDWEKIAGLKVSQVYEVEATESTKNIDALVNKVRSKVKKDIEHRCGTMRVLDMEQPIGLGDIYTKVNILEKLSGHRRLGIDDLLAGCDMAQFDRLMLGQVREERMPGVEAVKRYNKLMILGKPGAGKTTFMKRLATLCNQGQFQSHRVPVFVTLKEFAEAKGQPGLQDYIAKQWRNCGVKEAYSLADLFEQGLALILLDGLDEVQETEHDRVLQAIKDFTGQFRDCQFVMTCRIAAREYVFQQFTEVEIADFDQEQIAEFATKWFKAKKDGKKAETFIQRLENNKPIQELATNPLLLTLLCLVFGEAADFPANRAELYKEGLDVLLKKWDAKRNIERNQIYKRLSLQRKEDLLSQLAFYTFDRGDYFFKQVVAERHIIDYIRNLPGAQDDEAALQLDGADVLNSIEAQHGLLVERAKGIYSFSHLTFQEYFAAKQITRPTARLSIALKTLVQHINEERYREIFLLAIGILPEADELLKLMKYQIDQMLASEPSLQDFLNLVNRQTQSADVSFKNTAARAFLIYHVVNRSITGDIFDNVSRLVLDSRLSLALGLNNKHNLIVVFTPDICFGLDNGSSFNLGLTPKFKFLQEKLPNTVEFESWAQWWKEQGKKLLKDLKSVQIKYDKHISTLQFTETQKEKLKEYYDASKLLLECLNGDCYVTKTTRREIEDTLLLSTNEVEKHK